MKPETTAKPEYCVVCGQELGSVTAWMPNAFTPHYSRVHLHCVEAFQSRNPTRPISRHPENTNG